MVTSPTHQKRPASPAPPPSPPARERDDAVAEEHRNKKTSAGATQNRRPTKRSNENQCQCIYKTRWQRHETASNEDGREIERTLLGPARHDAEGLGPAQGMQQVKGQLFFPEIDGRPLTPERQANITKAKWDLKPEQQAEVPARRVAKG